MVTVLKTAPATIAVSVAEAKAHMNVTGATDDTYIETLLNAVTGLVEQRTGRKLITQTWYYKFESWPGDGIIVLPFGNTISVTSIKYTDEDGDESTLSSDDYTVDADSIPGRCVLNYDADWPTDVLHNVNPIVVEFVTGYGAAAAVPADIKHAIKYMVGHWYANREVVVIGTITAEVPDTFKSLISSYRLGII